MTANKMGAAARQCSYTRKDGGETKNPIKVILTAALAIINAFITYIAPTIVAFYFFSQMAYAERGYAAIGGEFITAVVVGGFVSWILASTN